MMHVSANLREEERVADRDRDLVTQRCAPLGIAIQQQIRHEPTLVPLGHHRVQR